MSEEKYYAEVRVFDKDGNDYINVDVRGDDLVRVEKDARGYGRDLGGKINITIFDVSDPYDWVSISSKIYYFGKKKTSEQTNKVMLLKNLIESALQENG